MLGQRASSTRDKAGGCYRAAIPFWRSRHLSSAQHRPSPARRRAACPGPDLTCRRRADRGELHLERPDGVQLAADRRRGRSAIATASTSVSCLAQGRERAAAAPVGRRPRGRLGPALPGRRRNTRRRPHVERARCPRGVLRREDDQAHRRAPIALGLRQLVAHGACRRWRGPCTPPRRAGPRRACRRGSTVSRKSPFLERMTSPASSPVRSRMSPDAADDRRPAGRPRGLEVGALGR